jgi:UDP-3-O-[3-hydroxymyristoyl] glucosamine N-acyltransferase
VVAEEVVIGDNCVLLPHVVIYRGAHIGNNFFAHAHAIVREYCRLGDSVVLQNGAVIGSDGFGFAKDDEGHWRKIGQSGTTEIDDNVEVQANACVDRASIGITRVGAGSKIDNLVQIAHNVHIGRHVCIVGQSGVAGSVHIGDGAVLGAGAGLVDHISVGAGARIAARAGVNKDVPAAATVAGTPSLPIRLFLRAYSLIPRLPEYHRKVKELEARCADLEAQLRVRRKERGE